MPNLLQQAAKANPCLHPPDVEVLLKHEEDVLKKRRDYVAAGQNKEELEQKAMALYQEFVDTSQRMQFDVWRVVMQRERIRQMADALEGRGWDRTPPDALGRTPVRFGVCSASLLRAAEEKHRERMASMQSVLNTPGIQREGADALGEGPTVVESFAEEEDLNARLQDLEMELGYDFSLEGKA